MDHLPYADLADEELIALTLGQSEITDFELELVERLERAHQRIAELDDGDDA